MTAWRTLKFSCNTCALTAKHLLPLVQCLISENIRAREFIAKQAIQVSWK